MVEFLTFIGRHVSARLRAKVEEAGHADFARFDFILDAAFKASYLASATKESQALKSRH